MTPLYDNEDSVCGIIYNGSAYYFYKNLQGDIIEIANRVGTIVARYSYDAWGKVTAITDGTGVDISNNVGHVANANPFRYRGYYYDAEIGMYYLQSRYYDPVVGRFINGDEPTIIFWAQQEILKFTIFSYCNNSPTNSVDDMGLFSFEDIKKFLQKIVNSLKQRLEDYFKSLFVFKNRFVQISTDVFSIVINIIIGLIIRGWVVKTFNTGLNIFKNTYLATHSGKAVEIMTKIVTFLLENGVGKFLVKKIAKYLVNAKIPGLSVNVGETIADGLLSDFIYSVNELAGKAYTVVSAFSSIGNLLAFVLCDLPDGKIDGKLTISW